MLISACNSLEEAKEDKGHGWLLSEKSNFGDNKMSCIITHLMFQLHHNVVT